MLSPIEMIIALIGRSDDVIHYPRWDDIVLPSGRTLRLWDDDGEINLVAFTRGAAMIEDGRLRFSHAFANPAFVAATVAAIIGTYSDGGLS